MTAEAYAALGRAHAAGLLTVPVTGRPAGWADHIARMWPVSGVVAENGALYLRHIGGRMIRCAVPSSEGSAAKRRERLLGIAREVLARVPGTALASDQAYREFDVAVDYCEDVPRLAQADIDRIVRIFEARGARTKVSSIHVNAWFGDYDKLGMLKRLLFEQHGADLDDLTERERFVFVGDSPNDEPMFRFFPHAVGVANIDDFADRLGAWPAYRTGKRSGAGFAELVAHLLANR